MNKIIVITILIAAFLISCNQSENRKPSTQSEANSNSEQALFEASHDDTSPLELGKEIALKTKGILGQNLMQAINSKGTEHALTFCSTRAIPLTDSMSVSSNASVKRVSDKTRNPNNKANTSELDYINDSKKALAKGETIKPKLTSLEKKYIAYYPIVTNSMCLQCHGQPEKEISHASLSAINLLYPHDKATGYKAGELRGIWVIEMDKL